MIVQSKNKLNILISFPHSFIYLFFFLICASFTLPIPSEISQENARAKELEANHAKCPVCHAVFRSMDIMRVHLRRHQVRYIPICIFMR